MALAEQIAELKETLHANLHTNKVGKKPQYVFIHILNFNKFSFKSPFYGIKNYRLDALAQEERLQNSEKKVSLLEYRIIEV